MNLKISLFSIVIMSLPVCFQAQTARNPLNLETAQVTLQKRISSWKLSEENFYRADDTPFDKRSYLYDENGRKTADVTLRWSKTDNKWLNIMQCDYRYEAGKEVVISKSGTQFLSKTETCFDAERKPLYALTFQWNKSTDSWSNHAYQRSEWVYNRNGLVTTCLKQHINNETNAWNDFDTRILYAYDETGALMEELFQSWNPEVNQWINRGQYLYTNVNDKQKIASSFIYTSGNRVSDGKTVYLYDGEGNLTRCEYYLKDTDETLYTYSVNTYTEGECLPKFVELNSVNVYPNPVVSAFELTVSSDCFGKTLQMYDISGKQVLTLPVNSSKTQIDVSKLTSGVYILKIGDISKKIILQ